MRTGLKEIGKETRLRYHATVGRFGIKSNPFKGFPERTIMLKNVVNVNTGEVVTDHLWFTVGRTLNALNLKVGDEITFNARVGTYKKGYKSKTLDYKLNNMSKIEVKRIDRELEEGEITSGTEPTFEELWAAQRRKVIERIENEEYM